MTRFETYITIILSLLIFIFLFYGMANVKPVFENNNTNYFFYTGDYTEHIKQAIHWSSFGKIDFQEFVDKAPLKHSIMYPGWHICFLFFYRVFLVSGGGIDTIGFVSALINALANTLCMLAITFILSKNLKSKHRNLLAPIFASAVIFCGPFYISIINKDYYLGQLFSGVWHNPTTQPLKVLTVIICFLYSYLYINRDLLKTLYPLKLIKISKLSLHFISLSILLLISALFKPSLAFVFLPTVFFLCIIDLFMTKLKSFYFCLMSGLAVLPVSLMILWQTFALGGYGGNKVVLAPMSVWNFFSPYPILSLIISLLFPIFCLIICFKQIINDKAMIFSSALLIISILEFSLFALEPGMYAGDFMWGMHLCTLIIFISSIILFCNYITEMSFKSIKVKAVSIIGFSFLLIHFISGLTYLIMVSNGMPFHMGGGNH